MTIRGRRLEVSLTSEERAELEAYVQITYKDHGNKHRETSWTMDDYGEERSSAYILWRNGTGLEITNVKVQFYRNGELLEEKDLDKAELKAL